MPGLDGRADPSPTTVPAAGTDAGPDGGPLLRLRPPAWLAPAAVLVPLAVLVVALVAGGGRPVAAAPGLPDAGRVTGWGLPVATLVVQGSAVLALGLLVLAAFLLPYPAPQLSATGTRVLRAAGSAALVWAVAAAAQLVLSLSDILGEPVRAVISPGVLRSYVGQIVAGRVQLAVVLIALAVAGLARQARTAAGAFWAFACAVAAVALPALTGHAAVSGSHDNATTSLATHLVAVSLWVGGLLALVWLVGLGASRGEAALAVRRYSGLALGCVLVVAVSGVVNAAIRVPNLHVLLHSRYGALVLTKVALLAVLVGFGWWQRRRALPAVARGSVVAFVRTAGAEVLVMGATLAVAVALSRTPYWVVTSGPPPTNAEILLGYPMPPALTVVRLLAYGRLEMFFAGWVLVGAVAYLVGVLRLRRRGDGWPWQRTVTWLAGLLTVAVVTQGGIGRYAPVLFSVHMAEHMTLTMLAPVLLVLGGPITLALRALRPVPADLGRGPREWLLAALHSRTVGVITNPILVTVLFATSTYMIYFTGLFEAAMRSHVAHIAMELHFLGAGLLFFWTVIGVDPNPHRPSPGGRVLMMLATIPFHAFFGIAIMSYTSVIAGDWYAALGRPWGVPALADQGTAGGIAWSFGEIPALVVLLVVFFQWARTDEREGRTVDRQSDRQHAAGEPDDLDAYNDMLARLARRDEAQRR